ncbi:MAG: metal ABC transporter permease [Eubacterium sp.]|nr:metal ABC transporter permease [Eubacterium sp.]
MLEMLSYDFFLRALLVGMLVSLCASLLGVSLVLKRFSMIGDGLSHVGFGALAVAAAMNLAPLQVSIPVVVIAAFLLLRVSGHGKINGDAAIAVCSSGALAIGAVILSQSGGAADINSYMFGSIMAITGDDLLLSVICSAVVIVLFILFYNKIFAVTFDESFSRATGVKTELYNTVIALLTALTVVVGMRIMGALLISSLIIFPALASMRIFKSFKSVTVCSAVLCEVCFIAGMELTCEIDWPAGASVVIANLCAFVIFSIVGAILKRTKKS